MKKVIVSLSIIAAVAAIVIGATGAFFSDTETSTGNTFTAGVLDLQIDDQCSYNGEPITECTWELKDLDENDVFFNYDDVKPGDYGENTISMHVENPAWVCAEIMNLEDLDNSCNEPEIEAEPNCEADLNDGELAENLIFTIWQDLDCDNILDDGEVIMVNEEPAIEGLWPIADSTTGTGPIPADVTTCIGVAWSLPAEVGNEVQSDSLTGDIRFTAIQERHNENYVCDQEGPQPEVREVNLENKDEGWQIISDDIYGLMTYSHNDTTFHGTVTGQGLEPNAKYQITLNGPGSCTATDDDLATFGANLFESGYWNNWAPNLSSTCVGSPGEGVYNMNLINDHYTVESDASGNLNYAFNLTLPAGDYTGVKVLVKKMLDDHVSPWVDTTTEHTTNLFETAAINFTVAP